MKEKNFSSIESVIERVHRKRHGHHLGEYMQSYNYKHVQGMRCHECDETTEILFDEQHGIIFCQKCGLILHDVCKRSGYINIAYYFDI